MSISDFLLDFDLPVSTVFVVPFDLAVSFPPLDLPVAYFPETEDLLSLVSSSSCSSTAGGTKSLKGMFKSNLKSTFLPSQGISKIEYFQ